MVVHMMCYFANIYANIVHKLNNKAYRDKKKICQAENVSWSLNLIIMNHFTIGSTPKSKKKNS